RPSLATAHRPRVRGSSRTESAVHGRAHRHASPTRMCVFGPRRTIGPSAHRMWWRTPVVVPELTLSLRLAGALFVRTDRVRGSETCIVGAKSRVVRPLTGAYSHKDRPRSGCPPPAAGWSARAHRLCTKELP